ncbi:hypothetical protein K435DRAFT_809902 [Dendrothele bispora CBS 962.96]|uniref:Zn(2)-C6 fungal-type domain-containing protein n=1 Tax=Dendrothele bispora (strain CBS 962.96) TaxID=1314807 RepID=A0A4V6T4Z5_DENBC|nr:hypothetical protein K435DRAFT_809902 [Dendrothele bispora CBS 962.96]
MKVRCTRTEVIPRCEQCQNRGIDCVLWTNSRRKNQGETHEIGALYVGRSEPHSWESKITDSRVNTEIEQIHFRLTLLEELIHSLVQRTQLPVAYPMYSTQYPGHPPSEYSDLESWMSSSESWYIPAPGIILPQTVEQPNNQNDQIDGHGVPLRVWDCVYKYTNNKRWKGVKSRWNDWKWVAEYYSNTTDTAFWAEFYDHDKDRHMTYTNIIKQLRDERKDSNIERVNELRMELGESFDSQLSYRGKTMTRVSAIARRSQNMRED